MMDIPNTTTSTSASSGNLSNNTITLSSSPLPPRDGSLGSYTGNGSNSFGSYIPAANNGNGSANSFTTSFHRNFHNNTISNKANFSTVVARPKRSDLPVPPHSPPVLTTLCIQAISKHINKINTLQSGMLPEELVHRVIAYLISDEMSVYIKQLDSSVSFAFLFSHF